MSCLRRIAETGSGIERCEMGGLPGHGKSHTATANAVFWSCAKNGSSTDMCMWQKDKEDPRKHGLTWWRMTVSNMTSTFIEQQRWLSIVRLGGARWNCLCSHPRRHGNRSSKSSKSLNSSYWRPLRYTDAWASLAPLWLNLTKSGVSKDSVSPPSSEYTPLLCSR